MQRLPQQAFILSEEVCRLARKHGIAPTADPEELGI